MAASRRAHESGKVIVNSAGNTAVPPLFSHLAGPPWVIAVGGAQPAARGEDAGAGKGGDVVANFTEWAAVAGTTDGMDWVSGTSFSTPLVAGTLAQAIGLVWKAHGGPAPPDALRMALNASASHWAPEDWDPLAPATNDTLSNILRPTLPALVPAQTGWGYVDGGLASEIARRVLEEDFSIPPEKAQTAEHMAQYQALREEYWRNAP